MKYYSLTKILSKHAKYNMVFGERSNGKSYAVQEKGLKDYIKHGYEMAIIRRWQDDFKGKRASQMFANLVCNGKGENVVKQLTEGRYDNILYKSGRWYLALWDIDQQCYITDPNPFCYAFALSAMEHDKSTSYPNIKNVLFDEFMTRGAYLPDEFVLFMNALSSIIRHRDDVTIFMCANTISKYCPYFNEMGLKYVKGMKKGDIAVYKYGNSGLTVAVEYSDSPNAFKPSDVYFAFDNPKLAMITGGSWELDIYPHITHPVNKEDICYSYFILFDDNIMQADIVINDKEKYTFIHRKTTPIKNEDKDIVFSLTPNEKYNYYQSLLKPVNEVTKKIISFFACNKVFYQSNDLGELMNQYLTQCQKKYT